MVRQTLWLAVLAVGCSQSSYAEPTATKQDKGPAPPQQPQIATSKNPQAVGKVEQDELVTKQLVEMNANDKWGVPASQFQAGSVSKHAAPSVTKTSNGFEVSFGNHSPVSTPTVYEGKLYSSGGFNSREFHALDAKSGTSQWSLALSDDGPSSSACAEGVCVWNTESCTVFAVDAKTGKQKWAWFLGDPQTSSPTIASGRVFTSYPAGAAAKGKSKPPTASHVLAAFDLKTGKVLWQNWLDADVISAPVAVGEFVYVSTFNGTVIKLEQATGKIRYASKARATSAPVVEFVAGLESMYYTSRADRDVAASSPTNVDKDAKHATHKAAPAAARAEEQIVRTDHNDPETRYKTPAKKADYLDGDVQDRSQMKGKAAAHDAGNGFSGGAPASANAASAKGMVGQSNVATIQQFQGSRILHMQKLNVNTMGDEVVGTDPDNGKQLWSHKLEGNTAQAGGFLGTPPLAAGAHVIVATLGGKILQIDPQTGKTEKTFDVKGAVRAQPVVVDGWIYTGTDDGRLVAIDTGDRSLTGWETWGGNAQRTGMLVAK